MEKNITIKDSNLNIFERNAKFIALLAIASGSTSGIFGKLITASSMAIGFYRLSFALPFFAIPVLLKYRDTFKGVGPKEILGCFIGGLFLFGHFFSWFRAVQTTAIASAVTLQSLHPLVVLLVTLFLFKQKISPKAILGIVVALIGGALIAGFDYSMSGDTFSGDIFAILAGTFYGLYFCVGNIMRKKIPAATYIFLVFFFCWICFTLGMVATATPFSGYPASDYLWLILMTLLCQIGAHAVFNWCLGYVTSLYLSAWGTAEIVISSVLAIFVFGEIPTLWQTLGAIIVIAGLLYYNYNEN